MATAVVVMPDAIPLLRAVLVADEGVSEYVGNRVNTVSPEDVSTPWIRLHQVGGSRSESAPQRLATRNVQVDCFAPPLAPGSLVSGDAGAMALALRAEAALFACAGTSNATGIVTYVKETQGPSSQPDTSRKPPTPRALFTLAVTVHPLP